MLDRKFWHVAVFSVYYCVYSILMKQFWMEQWKWKWRDKKINVFKLTLDRTISKVMFWGGALGTAEKNTNRHEYCRSGYK